MKAASLILVKDVSQGMICVCVQQEGISLVTSSLQNNIQLAVSDFCFCGIVLHEGLSTQPLIPPPVYEKNNPVCSMLHRNF
jgi:hypothetical protein